MILASILVLVLYYLNNSSSAEEKKSKPINHVSYQSVESQSKDVKPQSKSNKKPIIKPQDADLAYAQIKQAEEEKPDLELDYITAYRDWQYFPNCYTDIEDFHNEKDPLQTLAERFATNPRESQNEPTPQQNMYYQQHVDICKTLIHDVGDTNEEDDYYQILSKLESRFKSITPKTEEAKQLSHALEMVKQLKRFQRDYLDATYPVSNLPQEQQQVIRERIREVSAIIVELYEGNDVLTEQHTQQINLLSDEVEQLRNELLASRTINQDLMEQRKQQTDGYLNSIDDYLHKIQSPDAYIVLVKELYEPEYYQKDSTVLQRMKSQTGIQDSYYIRILNRLVTPLVACSMGYPCDAQSDYIMSYCLGLRDSMFNQACGSNLDDFYFNFYIGQNQMDDVITYYNFLTDRYAQ